MTTLPCRTLGTSARYRQNPLEHAPAAVSRPSRPKVTTIPRRTARVQKRAPLPPEPSRPRPCHGFAPLDTIPRKSGGAKARRYRESPLEHERFRPSRPKVTTLLRRTGGVQTRAPLPPEPSRVRPCHGFAALETKSDDPYTQNRGGAKARAATARAL